MDALLALKAAVSSDPAGFEVLDQPGGAPVSLDVAKVLRVGGREFDLDEPTAFKSSNPALGSIKLRAVVNCWICREMSVPQYIAESDRLGIPNLKFLERTDLVEWLEGSSTSDYIEDDVEMEDVGPAPLEEDTKSVRGALESQSTVLHGSKTVDFSGARALGHQYVVKELKSNDGARNRHSTGPSSGLPLLKPSKGKDPIILLSPSPSSLLNMANVQQFLERGVFEPVMKSAGSPNLLRILRTSNLIGPRVRFVVVDSVEQFKPEYWDRVVAVFITGQAWQFRLYKWLDPNMLFQNVLGFGLVYKNDPVPENMRQWNVKIEQIEHTARFRDREVMERIWERIESYMVSRGWPVHGA